jgi:pyrroloquinoline quinone biosynthesis protein D
LSFSETSIPRRRPGCESSRVGDGFVVLDGNGVMLRGLNPSAARIWELIDGEQPASAIAHRVAREFDADPVQVLAEVIAFLALLEEKQLVERTR